nr:hypothetical protein [Tanacetum cinerariifolium]
APSSLTAFFSNNIRRGTFRLSMMLAPALLGKKAIAEPAPPACDPRDVETIERLQQRIQELKFQQLQQDLPIEETYTESKV